MVMVWLGFRVQSTVEVEDGATQHLIQLVTDELIEGHAMPHRTSSGDRSRYPCEIAGIFFAGCDDIRPSGRAYVPRLINFA